MKIYNTLSRQIELINPVKTELISIYSCGPTVYDNLHIGNLSAFIYADVLRRVLIASNYKTEHCMNITDVDDKTIKRSREDYPNEEPEIALRMLTDKYSGIFIDDMQKVGNNLQSIQLISAVESIPDMIALIQKIIDNGIGYITPDGVYFSIEKYMNAGYSYGLFQEVDISKSRSRIANDEYEKDAASDFALWKAFEPGEPAWDAEFKVDGKITPMPGRPGWHIECSAMSGQALGLPFDIHTGGIDLRFPHHENEIAQTKAASGSELAKMFFHNAHIMVDGKKMSKSLGNFITLREIEEKKLNPMAFRLLVLESHYRTESNFSWDILRAACNRLNNWQSVLDLTWQVSETAEDRELNKTSSDAKKKIIEFLQDDIRTPDALTEIDRFLSNSKDNILSAVDSEVIKEFFEFIESIIGVTFLHSDITEEQKKLIVERNYARSAKNFAKADEARDELISQGIYLNDLGTETIWYRN